MRVREMVQKAHKNAYNKGFWEDYLAIATENDRNNAIGNRLMLVTSELGEALEAIRQDDWENFEEELADVVIRTCDLAGGLGIDLETAVQNKMKYNSTRPEKHEKQF